MPVYSALPQRVTSLPTGYDGQEIYYATSQNGVVWHLRYDANVTGSYKWTFVGGNPMTSVLAASWGTTTSTSFVTQGTAAVDLPAITTPLAGDYLIRGAGGIFNHAGGAYIGYVAVKIGAAATADADGANVRSNVDGVKAPWGFTVEKTALSASTALQMQARSYDANAFGPNASLTYPISLHLTPLRVG